jgi:FkbM family methyltransferase
MVRVVPQHILKRFRRGWRNEKEFLDGFLRNVSGVIHVGANWGQERQFYRLMGVDVVWVEPIREVYDKLVTNIADYERQRAINALITDKDGEEYEFKIANNNGASSSILDMDAHATLFPDIQYVEKRKLKSVTLQTLMKREALSPTDYQALVVDTEGAELMVFKGAGPLLRKFHYIKAEAADFSIRAGAPSTDELDEFLAQNGFSMLMKRAVCEGPEGGWFWDIVWYRRPPAFGWLYRPKLKGPLAAPDVSAVGWDKVPD